MRILNSCALVLGIVIASFCYGMGCGDRDIAISFDIDDVLTGRMQFEYQENETREELHAYFMDLKNKHALISAVFMHDEAAIQKQITAVHEKQYPIQNPKGIFVRLIYPVKSMIELVKRLKEKGYTIIAATNQPIESHQYFRKAIQFQHGLDFNDLFDAVLTISLETKESENYTLYYRYNESDNMYVMRKVGHCKPHHPFFHGVKSLVENINPQVKKIIHIDDQEKHVIGAQSIGLEGIHFQIPGGNVMDITSEQLENAVMHCKIQLREHGVYLD